MSKTGGFIGIIAGFLGVFAAIFTLFFGGLGAAIGDKGANTVIGLGWGGVLFSFLSIIFSAVVFVRPRGAGAGLMVSALFGAILGGGFVAVFMVLALIGGALAFFCAPKNSAQPQNVTVLAEPEVLTIPTKAKRTRRYLYAGAGVLLLLLIIAAGSGKKNAPSGPSELDMLAQATPVEISPTGEIAQIFTLNSKYTDLQRDKKAEELQGKIVRWTLPVYEVKKNGDDYRVTINSEDDVMNLGRAKQVGAYVQLKARTPDDVARIENLKTGDLITFQGKIDGVAHNMGRYFNIKPAILYTGEQTVTNTAPTQVQNVTPTTNQSTTLTFDQDARTFWDLAIQCPSPEKLFGNEPVRGILMKHGIVYEGSLPKMNVSAQGWASWEVKLETPWNLTSEGPGITLIHLLKEKNGNYEFYFNLNKNFDDKLVSLGIDPKKIEQTQIAKDGLFRTVKPVADVGNTVVCKPYEEIQKESY